MGQKTIDQLSSASALAGTEEVPIWQSGATVKLTIGSAITHNATDFDLAGAAATAQTNAETFATSAANTAQSNAEAYADAGDAPTVDANFQTTDGTVSQVAATYTPPHNSFVHVEASYLAFFNDKSNAKYHKVTAAFVTNNSGTVTMAGSPQPGDTKSTAGATNCGSDIMTNGTVVQLVVTGIAATIINWHIEVDVQEA